MFGGGGGALFPNHLARGKQEDSLDEGHARAWMEFFNVGFVLKQWNFLDGTETKLLVSDSKLRIHERFP